MKKMLILALIGLFYIVSSALLPLQTGPVDNDVGYALVANQNTTSETVFILESPVVAGEEFILIARGVSVPDKGLTTSEAIIYEDFNEVQWSSPTKIARIDLKLPTLTGFENQIDKYPFASDLGLRKS